MSDSESTRSQTGQAFINIGVSACVLGAEVRYNGGHKLSRFVRDELGAHVRFVASCPEKEIGMGVPRETVRLEREKKEGALLRMIAPKSGQDFSEAMVTYSERRAEELSGEDLCGYILQKGSPSCGMERVRIYPPGGGTPRIDGRGLFADVLMKRFPNLPVEEDGRLKDARLRENFIERVFAYRRLKNLFEGDWSVGDLVAFHSREKMLLLAHDRPAYTALGRLVAAAKGADREELRQQYERTMLTGLKKLATTKKHTNVLHHMVGYFRKLLDEGDREELRGVVDDFHRGLVPLVVPITLLRHHVRRQGVEYLERQTYLEPHPAELMLRNHV